MSDQEFMLLDADRSRRSRNQFLVRVLVFGFAFIIGFVIISLYISSETPQILKRPKFVGNCSAQYTYDFSLMTFRWPTSACDKSHSCLKFATDKWLIHGLWPTYANQSWPEFCCFDRKFDVKNLDPIKSDLLTDWPNLLPHSSEDSLWQHEWIKHGTCTKTKQIDYFNYTLNLYKQFPIYDWLKDKDIIPNNNMTYDFNTFDRVLTDKVGHKVQIKCLSDRQKPNSRKIEEILICIQHNPSTTVPVIIDCPEQSTCGQTFTYPQFMPN